MNILKAKIRWADEFCNDPTLQVLVDKIPDNSDLIYKRVGNKYFAELDGYVSFFFYAKPGDGYAGRSFTIKVENEDGTIQDKVLKGPWSSRCGAMNIDFTHSIDVAITEDPNVFERGHTYYSGYLTIAKAIEAIRWIQGVGLFKRTKVDGEITYFVTKTGFTNMSDKLELVSNHSYAVDMYKLSKSS